MAKSDLTQFDVRPASSSRVRILLGVFLGMVTWIALIPFVERPLSELIFGIPPGKQAWATPGYYCIHRTLLLALSAVGGTIGVFLSPMRRRYAFLTLFLLLAVMSFFAFLFPR